MLALLGLVTIVLLLVVIMTKRMSPLIALIVIPIAAALVGGFGLDTGKFVLSGIQSLAAVVGMFVFAILFFGVVSDAGMLDPIIDRILATVGTRPTRIVMGTTLLALLIHLDGSGAITFLITIPAMLPLYDRIGIDRRILACAASMAAGVNFLPWTGPMIRASAALKLPIPDIFQPLVPIQAVGLVFIFAASYWLGRRDRAQLAPMGRKAQEATGCAKVTVLADRGYYNGDEVLACGGTGVLPCVPKTLTSGNVNRGLFTGQDFTYDADKDHYTCPAPPRPPSQRRSS